MDHRRGPLGRLSEQLQQELEEARSANESKAGLAGATFAALRAQIEQFQAGLSEDEEVGACLATAGATTLVTVARLTYREPHLIVLVGLDERGQRVELVQHVSQVNLLFKAVPARGARARRISFEVPRSRAGERALTH